LSADQLGLWIGFILTLMVFSYLLTDNFLYRLAVHVFVGLTAGFTTMVTVESVLLPWLRATLGSGDLGVQILGALPLIFGLLLLFKASRRFAPLGGLALALMIGVGAAVAVVGAISGTLLPLAGSTSGAVSGVNDTVRLFDGFLIVLGVVCTLIYFQYAARRVPGTAETRRGLVVRAFGALGQGFIVVTLGALYGGAILSGLVIFSERIAFLLQRFNGG
jgi:hypothetical protein